MFLKLLVLSVVWLEVVIVGGEDQKDIYELEFWTRTPKLGNRRRSNRVGRPIFRHSNLENRSRRPLRDKSDDLPKSTRHEGPLEPPDKKKPQHEAHSAEKPNEENEAEASREVLSPYSLKQSMEKVSGDLGRETNITVEVIGRTFEYNDIIILKMAEKTSEIKKYFRAEDDKKYIDEAPEKKIIFIVHSLSTKGIRAVPCLYYRKDFLQLLKYYLDHLDKFDIYLIPLANPDGFIETYSSGYWNKNVSPQSICNGVDLDRNFDVAWGATRSSIGSCSQNYPGPTAFSEPETRAVREVFHRYGHKIVAYIHVHAGAYDHRTFRGEAVLYPKGYTEAQTDDDKYLDMKGEIDETMRNASFQRMTVTTDTLYHWYGKVTGTSVDYASTVFGIPYAMEFAMQPYTDDFNEMALRAVWKRVIDAVFNFIHKSESPSADAQNT